MRSVVWMAMIGTLGMLIVSGAGAALSLQPAMDKADEVKHEARTAVGDARDRVDEAAEELPEEARDAVSEARRTLAEARGDVRDGIKEARGTVRDCSPTIETRPALMKADPQAAVRYAEDRIDKAGELLVPEDCRPVTMEWL